MPGCEYTSTVLIADRNFFQGWGGLSLTWGPETSFTQKTEIFVVKKFCGPEGEPRF
jgi:hypothetical protein